MTFGQKLLRYRLRQKWTQEQIHSLTKVSVGAISLLERGKTPGTPLTRAKIEDRLPGFKEFQPEEAA